MMKSNKIFCQKKYPSSVALLGKRRLNDLLIESSIFKLVLIMSEHILKLISWKSQIKN